MLDRCRLVSGDFLESVPAGGDVYLISNVIHGQNDERSRLILRNCRLVMPPGAILRLLELILPPPGEPSPGHLADLTMMVVPGGQERTEQEYRSPLGSAGFELTRTVTAESGSWPIEARPL